MEWCSNEDQTFLKLIKPRTRAVQRCTVSEGHHLRAPATETDVTVAAALARGGWLAKSYVPTYQEGRRASLKIATYQKGKFNPEYLATYHNYDYIDRLADVANRIVIG